jgi:hypothetical protein
MIFDLAVVMIFDPAGDNKFDHAIIQDIRPSASRFFDPCGAEDFARHSSTPREKMSKLSLPQLGVDYFHYFLYAFDTFSN